MSSPPRASGDGAPETPVFSRQFDMTRYDIISDQPKHRGLDMCNVMRMNE